MILDAWDYRVSDILSVAEEFITESHYPITYNQTNVLGHLQDVLLNPNADILLHYEGDELAGGAIVARGKEFHTEYFGYMTKFFISKKFRGTGASRKLMQEVIDWFDTHECVVSFCSGTANLGLNKSFDNLVRKYGYEDCGQTLMRTTK